MSEAFTRRLSDAQLRRMCSCELLDVKAGMPVPVCIDKSEGLFPMRGFLVFQFMGGAFFLVRVTRR